MNKELKPEQITVIRDSREQTPADLTPMKMITGTLVTGDYSIRGLESLVSIERKTLQDLIGCVGRERERFEREIQRLRAYETRALFIDGSLDDMRQGKYRGAVHPNSAIGSVMGWMQTGLPVMFCNDTATMNDLMRRFLYITAQRYYKKVHPFIEALTS